jgi:hypothetical protein
MQRNNMENIDRLSNEELRELILEQIKNLGVDLDAVEIEVINGPKVVLRGKVGSDSEREMIKQTIIDIVGIDDVVDELVVIQGVDDGLEDEESREESELRDQDEENMGTEDAFQSVEDGIPYIPPTSPTYQESPKKIRWKKRKKKT